MRRHLFLAMSRAAMGEMTLGVRLAWELHRAGDEVLFLAPAAHGPLLAGTPFRHGATDSVQDVIHDALPGVIAKKRCDDVVLIDLTSNFIAFALLGIDPRFLARLAVPVCALDIWNVAETDLVLDTGPDVLPLHPSARELTRLLIPVPFVRPDAGPAVYSAWPDAAPLAAEARAARRRELGLDDDARLLFITTARWQTRTAQRSAYLDRLIAVVPELLLGALARLPPSVRLLHVGPEPFAAAGLLGERYHHERSLPPEAFTRTLGAADLMLNLNQSATSTLTALAMGVPALSVINSHAGETAAELAARIPSARREVLERLAPLHRFRMWPLGAYRYLGAALRDNPYPVPAAELLEEEALVESCRRLLFDAAVRAELAARTAAYAGMVRALPTAAQRLRTIL